MSDAEIAEQLSKHELDFFDLMMNVELMETKDKVIFLEGSCADADPKDYKYVTDGMKKIGVKRIYVQYDTISFRMDQTSTSAKDLVATGMFFSKTYSRGESDRDPEHDNCSAIRNGWVVEYKAHIKVRGATDCPMKAKVTSQKWRPIKYYDNISKSKTISVDLQSENDNQNKFLKSTDIGLLRKVDAARSRFQG